MTAYLALHVMQAEALTTAQILESAYDSTTKTLRMSYSASGANDVTALTNEPTYPWALQHETSGAPANGIGVGLRFIQETSAANNETIAAIAAVVSDVTAGSEDAGLAFKLMAAGAAAADKMTLGSTGLLTLVNAATIDNTVNGTVTITEPNIVLSGVLALANAASFDNSVNGTLTITEPSIVLGGALTLPACSMADGDATPSVTGCYWMVSAANTAPTVITDLDNPVVGATYCIIAGDATNPPTIADADKFALSAAWNPGIDDNICLYVQADNDYIEISRSNN